jgi:hypothetical protein
MILAGEGVGVPVPVLIMHRSVPEL